MKSTAAGSKSLDSKVAVISGGSRGVGYATARALVARGVRVALGARGDERLARAKRQLTDLGGEVVTLAGDIGAWETAERLVAAAMDAFGRIDIVVNNAGVSMRGEFAELTPEVCERVVATNLLGSLYLSRAAIEPVRASGGQLVFISSIAGLFGLPGASAYCASKGALTGLAESLRLELADDGVHVGLVYLGFTEHDPDKRILAADGSDLPVDRPAHHTQRQAAELILRLIDKRKKQVIMTPVGTLGWLAHRLSPGLVETAIHTARAQKWGLYERFA